MKELDRMKKALDFFIERADEGGCVSNSGRCGVSSNAMCRFMIGYDHKPRSHPYDNADWDRCKRTIERIPHAEWLERLYELPNFDGWSNYREQILKAVTERLIELKDVKLSLQTTAFLSIIIQEIKDIMNSNTKTPQRKLLEIDELLNCWVKENKLYKRND